MRIESVYLGKTIGLDIRRSPENPSRYTLALDSGRKLTLEVLGISGGRWTLRIGERIEDLLVSRRSARTTVDWKGRRFAFELSDVRQAPLKDAQSVARSGVGVVTARMPGKVVEVLKVKGDQVAAGEGLVIIEAMKMQNELRAPKAGEVVVCNVEQGQTVEGGRVLYEIS